MIAQPIYADLPPQLRDLSAKIEDLPDPVRNALHATLAVAANDATPEQVMADTFHRLGCLPGEATHATRKLLA